MQVQDCEKKTFDNAPHYYAGKCGIDNLSCHRVEQDVFPILLYGCEKCPKLELIPMLDSEDTGTEAIKHD